MSKLIEVEYEVDVGSGCTTGSVFVDSDANDDEIRLAIINDLYSITHRKLEE